MLRHPALCATPISLAVASLLITLLPVASAQAQSDAAQASDADLPAVSVSAPKAREGRASVSGLGDEPEWQQPLQAQRFGETTLRAAQVKRLADVVKLDASISDFYNAEGYWDFLSVRGFVLDSTANYRREGLPINTQTSIALDNKAAIEVFKGTSGMQAGMSSPGGLVNYLVKRPDGRIRSAELSLTDAGDMLTAVDLGDRFGASQQYGLRINAAHERLNTHIDNTKGKRDLLALAGDWRLAPGTLIEAEVEYNRREQHSVPGFSMFGSTLPSASNIDRKVNTNNQIWALPVVMQGTTGTLRLTQDLVGTWKAVGTYGEQHTKASDRGAFPYGAPGCIVCDRFSDTGTFMMLSYRSEGEQRRVRSLDAHVSGQFSTGAIKHDVAAGLLRTLSVIDLPTSAFTYTGIGDVTGTVATPYAAVFDQPQNNRQERSTELYLRDSIQFSEDWRAWAGARRTQLARAQSLSDDSVAPSKVSQVMGSPWLALGYQFAPMRQVYASWGEGIEVMQSKFSSTFVPISNSGEVLPALKSRQWEVGVKGQSGQTAWSVDYFHIIRPEASSIVTSVNGDGLPVSTYQIDGRSRHQGIEGQLRTPISAYSLDLSAMMLNARREGSLKDGINGKAPTNVPDYTVKIGNGYRVAAVPALSLQGDIVHEGPRTVDAVNDVRIPAWTRLDAGLALAQNFGSKDVVWRLGVTNLLDTKAWREAPSQFDHIYLIPMAARTFTASAQLHY
jgi:iron complex outermembrane receptor protein